MKTCLFGAGVNPSISDARECKFAPFGYHLGKKSFQYLSLNPWLTFHPIGSMYGIFNYIWLFFTANVGTVYIPFMDPVGMKS